MTAGASDPDVAGRARPGGSSALHRFLTSAGLMIIVLLGGSSTALADAAAPSDYESTVVSVEPATDAIEVRIVGGDSFIMLTADPGTRVEVAGYEGEPYLRFLADGTVERNERSPARFLNESRYGTSVAPSASADAEPEWQVVATGGRYAWHDHRGHWMLDRPPSGAARGDVVQTGLLPLRVDGVDTAVTIETRYAPSASTWPAVVGAAAGLAVAALAVWRRSPALALAAASGLALAIGWWQFASLPAETGPQFVWWLLPALALVAALAAVVVGRDAGPVRRLAAAALALLGAVFLAVWFLIRRQVLVRPILPTDAPWWFDRAVTAGSVVVAVVAGAVALWPLVRPPAVSR